MHSWAEFKMSSRPQLISRSQWFGEGQGHPRCPSFFGTTYQFSQDPEYPLDPAVKVQLHRQGQSRVCEPHGAVWLAAPTSDTLPALGPLQPSCCSSHRPHGAASAIASAQNVPIQDLCVLFIPFWSLLTSHLIPETLPGPTWNKRVAPTSRLLCFSVDHQMAHYTHNVT